jgi:hypothetical protein
MPFSICCLLSPIIFHKNLLGYATYLAILMPGTLFSNKLKPLGKPRTINISVVFSKIIRQQCRKVHLLINDLFNKNHFRVFVILIIAAKKEDPAVYSRGDDLTKVVLKRRVCWLISKDKLILQEGFGKLFYRQPEFASDISKYHLCAVSFLRHNFRT